MILCYNCDDIYPYCCLLSNSQATLTFMSQFFSYDKFLFLTHRKLIKQIPAVESLHVILEAESSVYEDAKRYANYPFL